jgi:hypothetical protein
LPKYARVSWEYQLTSTMRLGYARAGSGVSLDTLWGAGVRN